ncbi:MAG: hypothetical protein K8R40_11575 [Anaerolineaceae bacterium]|nr:hypothetical protein [Anaerolineaceae bacterium]
MKKNQKILIGVIFLAAIIFSAAFLLPKILLNNFGQCHAENDACCRKLGSLSTCTHINMACSNDNALPVFKGCDSDCKHIVVCVEKVESEFGDDTEINKTCSADSDCKLPMSYAILSHCPYEMKCIDNKCTVICLWDESFFPTLKEPATSYMEAELSGELALVDGCLRINDGYDDYLIVWPYGFGLSINENGIIQVIDDTGHPIMKVGDKVKVGGGGGEMSGEDSGDISAFSGHLPSDRCPGPYWILGEIDEVISYEK